MPHLTRTSSLRNSFQFKLFSIFSAVTFLMVCVFCTSYIITEIAEQRQNASDLLKIRTEQLADSIRLSLYAEDIDALRLMADKLSKVPAIEFVRITTSDGRVLVEVTTDEPSGSADVISHKANVLSATMPSSVDALFPGTAESKPSKIGTVEVERGTSDLSNRIFRDILFAIIAATCFWVAVTVISYLLFRRLTASFNALMLGLENVRNGNYTSPIEIKSDDEAARAASAVNNLAVALQESREENIRLHEESLNLERQMLHAQKLESLGVMAGGIAHDFNNLLQAILGNIELAELGLAPDSNSKKHIRDAMTAGRHAAYLASLMLTYVGKGFIVREEVDLNALVSENVEILGSASFPNVSMKLFLSPELPAITGSKAQIQQLVMNLITNAAESLEKQPGIIRATTGVLHYDKNQLGSSLLAEKPEPGSFAFIEVDDNGCGMTKETIGRLFDPFFTTKFTGRGLGMSAVMGIMKSHFGAIFVESEPGRGTTFKALFPIQEVALQDGDSRILQLDSTLKVEGESKGAMQINPLSGLVLVADDEKSVLKVCSKMVRLCGFRTITAIDGVDAVAKFREHADEIAVVLLDLTMPKMDGITAMAEIRGIRPDAKIIIASGFNEDELTGRITDPSLAPSGSIRKPYNMNALEAELRRVMQEG